MTVTWNPVTPDSESVSIILQYKVRNADPPELCQLKLEGNVTSHRITGNILYTLKNSEYDQEITQSQTADKPMAARSRANHHETPGRQTKQSNQLYLSHQDDCKTRMDIK